MSFKDSGDKEYDLCIVGSGPAGLITALEYTRLQPEHSVVIIEYGDSNTKTKNDLDDSIQVTNLTNHHEPYECTNKGFGGTSATWGGRCVMYDEVDFVDRPIIADGCTWDLDLFRELDKYLARSADYFECGKAVFNINEIPQFKDERVAENFREGIVTDSVVERWSMPTRFGSRYADDIAARPNLTVLRGYEAREFVDLQGSGHFSILKIRKIGQAELFDVKAKAFVIAAGAQESTRILLRNSQLFNLLPALPAALGKYYQGHLSGKIASVRFYGGATKTDYGFLRDEEGIYLRRRFQFTDKFLTENNLLNTAIWLDNPLYYDPKHRSGAMSFMYLAMLMPILGKKLAPAAIAESITKGKRYGISRHIGNVFRQFPKSLVIPATIFYKRYLLKRKLPGVFLFSPENRYALHFHSEQIPDVSNRMELGPDRESLVINYSLLEEDINSVIKLHKVLDNWLRETGCGELEYWYPDIDMSTAIRGMSRDGIHQSGTTRIADSPERGVVDRQLKVWGTKNVYVCSSSVFPTSSQANPTFFLGAFAVRLAEHLTKQL
ncbi:GMC oxidoreductase [Spirosoma spitsbergense]|uniref:GMC oxidoreductase n=1 Tax=Spirosoma spitsbergense TaxID=431554 RepID=UPI00036AEAEE|nr:GMC oxidoreductase [Spirosoma spitsbergense]